MNIDTDLPGAEILLVEDSPTDVMMAQEAFARNGITNPLRIVSDGALAMRYLRREEEFSDVKPPRLVILDINLPCKSGREVLSEIKNDPTLCKIAVVVLTTSSAEEDIAQAYALHANSYVVKPPQFAELCDVVRSLNEFWIRISAHPRIN